MQLYNSLSRSKDEFAPVENQVRLYVCGITPYDTTHLGHAFTYAVFDVLIRYLESQNVSVHYVQNVTDIDDDILRKAKQVGADWQTLGNEWTRRFIDDMRALNVRPPDEYPRATQVIPEIVRMTGTMLDRGVAYAADGSVYFDADAFPQFGELSHLPRGEMLPVANERGNNPNDPNKRHPLDFVLWQRKADDEPAWRSPWSDGRPGWHIECCAMVNKYLGPTIDIHGGGADLIFPHHECEIAESASATGILPFSRVWMHIAMVRYRGEKMSKSLGNLILMDDLLKQFSPDAVRLYLASHHYRDSWEYDRANLEWNIKMAERWTQAARGGRRNPALIMDATRQAFRAALDNDLDTPQAIAVLDGLASEVLNDQYSSNEKPAAQATLLELAGILGLRLGAPVEERVTLGWDKHRQRFL